MKKPQVSIGMPVFNDILFIEKAINSLLSQTFLDFELIISDDLSTDGSALICKNYEQLDSRIRYIRQHENIGISRNMKYLLNEAKGKYFMWAADDDLWHQDFIQILVTTLEENPDSVVAFGGVMFIDQYDNEIEKVNPRFTDYRAEGVIPRVKKLVRINDDSFGYGLFVREKILDVEFPVWWWYNKECAYNNIYPTLVYYLSMGNFKLATNKYIWFNRLKDSDFINHKVPFNQTFIRATFFHFLRKINLVYFSIKLMIKADSSFVAVVKVLPTFIKYWILIPSYWEFRSRLRGFMHGRLDFI